MNSAMRRPRHWTRARRRGIAEILGAVLLVGLTLIAGILLWSFRIDTPASPPSVGLAIRSGGSNPVWGDPTDCQPRGDWSYPLPAPELSAWQTDWQAQCRPPNVSGNFSLLNTSEIIISQVSATNFLLSDIVFSFVCNNVTGATTLVQGTLDSMSWYPGATSAPAANAPLLGYCGNFDAGGFHNGAFGTLYNRLGMFVPVSQDAQYLQVGDTYILYIHNGGWPLDYGCVVGIYPCPSSGLSPILDADDYHGAPPWCFTTPSACTIYLTYTGTPQTTLATIPVYTLAPPTGA